MLRAHTDPAQTLERGLLQIAALQCLLIFYCELRFEHLLPGAEQMTAAKWMLLLVHGIGGGLLVLGQRDEPAARLFGSALILVGPIYGSTLTAGVPLQSNDPLLSAAAVLSWFPTDAFGSFFFWRFVGHFPRATNSRPLQRLLFAGAAVSLAIALVLVPVHLYAGAVQSTGGTVRPMVNEFLPLTAAPSGEAADPPSDDAAADADGKTTESAPEADRTSLRDQIVFGWWLLALPVLGWRLHRYTTMREHRRTRSFIRWLLIGLIPVLAFVALIGDSTSDAASPIAPLLQILVASTLVACIWFAFRRRIFDVQLLVQNLFSRVVLRDLLIVALFVPALLLAHDIWTRGLGNGRLALWLLLAVLLPQLRPALSAWLESRLDLESGRHEAETKRVIDRIQEIEGRQTLLPRAEVELATALRGPVRIVPFEQPSATSGDLVAARLAERVFALRRDPLLLDHASERDALDLDEDESRWIERSDAAVLAPVLSSTSELQALVIVGPRTSQRAFNERDRDLLAIASRVLALRLEELGNRHRALAVPDESGESADVGGDEPASQCLNCAQLHPPDIMECRTCGGLTSEAKVPLFLGDRLRFEVALGTGSLGTVYRARDLRLGRTVAVKALNSESSERAFALQREAATTAAVDHPFVVQILSAERWRHRLLLVGEYADGGTLQALIEQGPVDWRRVVQIGRDLCAALDHAHRLPLVHGDIKPSNIALMGDGRAKLLDFGLAEMLHPSSGKTQARASFGRRGGSGDRSGGLRGTLLYVPPEAHDGAPLSPAFDLWALGLVMIEALLGDLPLNWPEPTETPAPELDEAFEKLSALAPQALVGVLQQTLASDPGRRYPDAARLRAALHRVT